MRLAIMAPLRLLIFGSLAIPAYLLLFACIVITFGVSILANLLGEWAGR